MNPSGLRRVSPLEHPLDDRRGADPTDPRRRGALEALSAWLLGAVSAPPTDPGPPPTPDAWRSNDERLTAQRVGDAPAAGGSEGALEARGERIVARTTAEGIGEVCVVVDRSSDGVAITLGIREPHAVAAASAARLDLVRALAAAGVRVASVAVGSMHGTGIAEATEHVPSAEADSVDGDPAGATPARRRRRFDWKG